MPRRRPLLSALVLGVLLALPAAAQPVGIRWQHDIESAKKLARESGRLVLIHFWTESCGPCKMLDQNVFNQAGVGTAIEAQFVPVKLNADQNSATATGFGITRVPTDIVITPDGEVVGRMISPPTPSAYVAEVSQIASQYATRPGQSFANAAAAAPLPAFNERVNSAYAGLPIGTSTTPAVPPVAAATGTAPVPDRFAATAPFAAPQLQVPSATPAAGPPASYAALQQAAASRYGASMPVAQAPPAEAQPLAAPQIAAPQLAPPAMVGNRYATAPPVDAAPAVPPVPAPNQFANPYAAGPPQLSPVTAPVAPFTAPTIAADQPPVGPPAAATAATAAENSRSLPPGAPPLGFDGYCPVTMRKEWKWVAGNPQFGIIHRGRTYWFAGAEQQKEFWENPDHFSPALSGFDPVLAIDHKQQVPGKREHSLDYDNLFYLFSSEATLQQFAANPERYATGVRQAMNIQRGRFVR